MFIIVLLVCRAVVARRLFFCSRAIFGRVCGVLTQGGASCHRHAESPLNGVFCKNNKLFYCSIKIFIYLCIRKALPKNCTFY